MDSVNIGLKCRPIKLAFLVEPNDKKALAEAIKINSILWGGMYNPIIPIFSKSPKVWKKNDPISRYKGKDILKGYLEAYDPDFVVPIGKCTKRKLDVGDRKIISAENIVDHFKKSGTPDYGLGIFEVLRDFYNEELKFVRQTPLDIRLLDFKKNTLFYSAVFGDLYSDTKKQIEENWNEYLQAKKETVDFSNYSEFLESGVLFLRRIMHHKIEVQGRGSSCLFYMDAENSYDIIDYWNLRALGWTVIPVAKQATTFESTKKMAKDFVEEHSGTHRHNKDYYIHTTVMRSRSVEDKEVTSFMQTLDIKADEKSRGSRWSFQHWYPRLWDEWARDKDHAQCCELESGSSSESFPVEGDRVEVKTVDPVFAERFGGDGSPRYANVMSMKIYSSKDIYAEAIPNAGSALTRTLSGMGLDEWRFSKKESVYLVKHKHWSIHVPIPKAEDVFQSWMKDNGFDIKLSTPGKIAKQMTRQLGGLWGIGMLANEELIKLLRDMQDSKINELSALLKKSDIQNADDLLSKLSGAQVGKVMNKDAFMARLSKIANAQKYSTDSIELLKRYTDHKMFRLGATVQCPICSHSSWYGINQLEYSLQCTNCLDKFDTPTHSPEDITWAYRTFGPFSLSGSAEGSYPTLLVLRLFARVFDFATTPCLSFLTKIAGKEKEVDLGLLVKESKFRADEDVRAVFVECKSYNDLQKSDIDKMDAIAKKFPGAVIVFATLKDSLSKKEKALLKPLVNRCRKYWKSDQPYNPVLILTKTELFAQISLNYAWEDATEKHKAIAKNNYYSNKLLHACDATQQLYLDMKPWEQEIHEKFEKRRKKVTPQAPIDQAS